MESSPQSTRTNEYSTAIANRSTSEVGALHIILVAILWYTKIIAPTTSETFSSMFNVLYNQSKGINECQGTFLGLNDQITKFFL